VNVYEVWCWKLQLVHINREQKQQQIMFYYTVRFEVLNYSIKFQVKISIPAHV